jgi:thioredoxin reductase
MKKCKIAVVGAGPYGLSIAAHLKSRGADFRIVGHPMSTWQTQMPRGMHLKSEGFASCLYDAEHAFTLRKYSDEQHLPYADIGLPVPLETFIAYGKEFQKRYVPELEHKLLVSLEYGPGGFRLCFDDGENIAADRVVVAVGICHFGFVPPELATLPAEIMTHSSAHSEVVNFRGRDMAIVGAGASAADLAALLYEAGARVQLIARRTAIRFHDPPSKGPRSLVTRMRNPKTGIGPGWKLAFCANTPWAFRYLPEHWRLRAVKRILGPAPGWFVKDRVVGKVPMRVGVHIERAAVQGKGVRLDLVRADGTRETMFTEHVIAATGYRVDLRRLNFMAPDLLARIRTVDQSPILSSNFESSVPGLYFVGTAAANTFGPLMRFACGAEFVARRLSNHLVPRLSRKAVYQVPIAEPQKGRNL